MWRTEAVAEIARRMEEAVVGAETTRTMKRRTDLEKVIEII